MEEQNVNWTETNTVAAADDATCLSELLSRDGFLKSNAICWLSQHHIAKFTNVVNATEAQKIKKFADSWHFTSEPNVTRGLPFLEELNEVCGGFSIICRLSEHFPSWLVRWWKWRARERGESTWHGKRHNKQITGLIAHLSRHSNDLDGVEIVDVVIAGLKESKALELLDELIKEWEGSPGSDPVTLAIKTGHDRLVTILHLPWQACSCPSGKDSELWNDQIGWNGVGEAIAIALNVAPANLFRLELGFSCGSLAQQGVEPSLSVLSTKLRDLGITPTDQLVQDILPMTELWATLRKLAEYESKSWNHKTKLIGLRAKIVSLVATDPQLWAQSLQWILARSSAIGPTTDSLTVKFSCADEEVRSSLEIACDSPNEHVRLTARGIRTLLLGLDEPDSALGHMLADAAARYMDGIPMFPHPLAPLSSTWLASVGVEYAISSAIKRACERFAAEVRDQGGDIEESLTKALGVCRTMALDFEAKSAR